MQFNYKKGLECCERSHSIPSLLSLGRGKILSDYHLMALVRNEYTFCGGEYTATLQIVVVCRILHVAYNCTHTSRIASVIFGLYLYNKVFQYEALTNDIGTTYVKSG